MPRFAQQVTFLYAEDPEASWRFYEEVLELPLAQDQGTCRIYETAEGGRAFLGVCRARAPRSEENPRAEGGVVFTFVTPDVEAWHARLAAKGVALPPAPQWSEAYRVTHFFLRDPAGYLLEVQRFDRPDWPEPG
ncbi:VOC family protein [Sabulicella glaciei]|uniref:VOC family protein n=1 Tax=Sabulicella glaciei TaxID=2984948 RepID=A0ABT3P0G9_9PROT|nr:VOC family protein [Roseococcus sp. MDT2-1-1]MCW8087902.1 VOC family protein [Roseococcus sp. MDT2-1-1]